MVNDFYAVSGWPTFNADGDSASARAEFTALLASFDKMPALTGSALRIIRVNAGNSALESVTKTTALIMSLDGTTTPTANLPMGGFKLTGLAAGTTAGDSVRYEQVGTLVIAEVHAASSKATPVDADELPLADSAATFGLKKLTWANLKATFFSSLGVLIAAGTGKTTPIDADTIVLSDSAAAGATKNLTWVNIKATLKTYFDTLYATLSAANAFTGANTFSALQTFNNRIDLKNGANIASATTVDLTAATGNLVHITGTTATTGFTMNAGQKMDLIADAAWPLTYNATTMNLNGNLDYTCAAGDRVHVEYDGTTTIVSIIKQDGSSITGLQTGSFTATGVGFSGTAPTATWDYIIRDGYVTLTMGTLSGTSNAVTFDVTGLPVALRPAVQIGANITVIDNTVFGANGSILVGTGGAINVRKSAAANWTSAGIKGITTGFGFGNQTITYKL